MRNKTSSVSQDCPSLLPQFGKLASSAPCQMPEDPCSPTTSAALGDHIGMVRPSYEAPTTIYVVNSVAASSSLSNTTGHTFLNVPYTLQVDLHTTPHTSRHLAQGKKLVSIVPKPESEEATTAQPFVFKSVPGGLRNDKKCRKVSCGGRERESVGQ